MPDRDTTVATNARRSSGAPVATANGRQGSGASRLASLAQLQAFAAVAEHGSFTQAAGVIGISQPAISELVRRLEMDLDVQLIRRRGGVLALTAAGERLLPHALQAVTSAQAGVRAVRQRR